MCRINFSISRSRKGDWTNSFSIFFKSKIPRKPQSPLKDIQLRVVFSHFQTCTINVCQVGLIIIKHHFIIQSKDQACHLMCSTIHIKQKVKFVPYGSLKKGKARSCKMDKELGYHRLRAAFLIPQAMKLCENRRQGGYLTELKSRKELQPLGEPCMQ